MRATIGSVSSPCPWARKYHPGSFSTAFHKFCSPVRFCTLREACANASISESVIPHSFFKACRPFGLLCLKALLDHLGHFLLMRGRVAHRRPQDLAVLADDEEGRNGVVDAVGAVEDLAI